VRKIPSASALMYLHKSVSVEYKVC
jgi:hypothetical protein